MKYYRLVIKSLIVLVSALIILIAFKFTAKAFIGKSLLLNPSGYSKQIYAKDEQLLKLTLSSDDKYRIWTPLNEISPLIIEATLSAEDRYFYYHPGVNPYALIKGFWSTYVGGNKVGASTLTMQLARLRFGLKTRSIFGKIEQIFDALFLETLYSKDEILEAYFNIAPYGSNVEGVSAASLIYFAKKASDLNWAEAISLSVIPQDPNNRIPANNQKSFELAKNRLLEKLKAEHQINNQIFELRYPAFNKNNLPNKAPQLVQRLVNTYSQDLKIYSSIDINLQERIERLLDIYITRNQKIGIKNAGILLVESKNLKTRAYIGSANFWSKEILGQNDAITARRSPGSALKPFLYALALDKGLIHPGSLLIDTEFSKANYNPENYEKDFIGPINATEALIRSRNIPAVMLLNQISPAIFYRFLHDAEIKKLKDENFYGLSLILGGVEVRMDEMAKLYAMLSNGGKLGSVSFLQSESPEYSDKNLLSPEASNLTIKMLSENPRPLTSFDSSQTVKSLAVPWKTGTSFGFKDAWAAGLVGPYTLIVWVGNFDASSNPAFIGRDAAGPLFFSVADALNVGTNQTITSVAGVKKIKVCAISGELPNQHCKHLRESWFIPGKSPIKTCEIHREIFVNPATGKRVCALNNQQSSIKKVVEFWPSDLVDLFTKAGLPRTTPPAFEDNCNQDPQIGKIPMIQSPQANIIYKLEDKRKTIPFSAVTDGDSQRTFWFVDDSFIGDSAATQTIFWNAHQGEFLVRAVDSQGRSNQVLIKVEETFN